MAPGRTTKRRRVSPPGDEDTSSRANRAQADFVNNAAEWDLEQDYERRPRKVGKKDREVTRLPIKTDEGFQAVEESEQEADESDSFLGTDDEDEGFEGIEEEPEPEEPKVPLKLQIVQAKEEIARVAMLINEDPEDHISSLRSVADMASDRRHVAIQKLALASQAAIYKDIIPGYRIRPLTEADMSAKVSKDVRKVRNYEQALLTGYKNYVNRLVDLTKATKGEAPVDPSLKSVALNCACTLLLGVPHFNCRPDLTKILVNRLARRQADADFVKCRETMEEVFEKDEDGIVSLEAVRLLSKMMKGKEFRINESLLDTFLHLRLLAEFSSKGSRDRIDRPSEETFHGKKKQKKEFRTKRERKVERERKVVEKDMKEADALVSHEERDKNQAETLKLVFGVYFRILKQRIPKLMGPVLEGLAKYAHLINQDFFGDLLEAMKDLIGHADEAEMADGEDEDDEEEEDQTTRDTQREALLCNVTAFALLDGQDASKAAGALHLDLTFFVKHLYRSLYPMCVNPDVEYNPNSALRLPDPDHSGRPTPRKKVDFQTPTVLLLRCLQSALLSRAHGTPPPSRLGSFAKRLMTISLQLPEKSAIATLSLLNQVAKFHSRRISSLWHSEERKGDGVFNPYAADVEGTNVFAGTVWEGELLRLHYCPQVREGALDMEKMISVRK